MTHFEHGRLGFLRGGLWLDRIIACCQIIGASTTAVSLIEILSNQRGIESYFIVPIFIVSFAILATNFLSGIWLWNGETRGYFWSSVAQGLQIPFVVSISIIYKFIFGFGIYVYYSTASFPVTAFNIGGQGVLSFLNPNAPFQVGINIWAAVVLVYLLLKLKSTTLKKGVESIAN